MYQNRGPPMNQYNQGPPQGNKGDGKGAANGTQGPNGNAPGPNVDQMQQPGPGSHNHVEPDWSIKEQASEFEQENDFVQFFKYIQGHHTCTHSSMIGPSDHRIPRSGKFDVTKPEALQKLYAAVSFFYRQGKPLVLCEIATSRFRFFEDVDLILSADLKDQVQRLQSLWIDQLLRHRAAVLGAVWRSDDPLGVKCRYTFDPTDPNGPQERAVVHVFSSSGWSSRHNLPKVSLHFVWPNLICTPREAKGIRSATIEFLRESCSPELNELLKGFNAQQNGQDQQRDMDQSPWEEIFDRAATEGTSLRLVWCDKGSKADAMMKTSARLEGRPKIPIGTYHVPLVAGNPPLCTPELVDKPETKTDVQWLLDASIRLDGSIADIPNVSNIWLSASQTKGLAGINLARPLPPSAEDYTESAGYGQGGQNGTNNGNGLGGGGGSNDPTADAFQAIKKDLLGKHVDQNSNWMTVEEYTPPVSERMAVKLDATGAQIAELVISPDVYSFPVDVDYVSMDGSGKTYRLSFNPSIDKYGTFFLVGPDGQTLGPNSGEGNSWMWRKPAAPQINPHTGQPQEWPAWAEFILVEIAGHADAQEKSMGLAAIICAVSNVPTSGKVHGEAFWKGHMSFSGKDFGDENVAVNVPLATVAAVVFGLKAVLDLREKIGGPKIKGIFISSDHTVVEAAVDGQASVPPYLDAICKLLLVYKTEILDDDAFPSCFNFAVSKISASANKAAKIAKEARTMALDDDMAGCSMGDIELYDSVIQSCEAAYQFAEKTGGKTGF